MIASFSAPHPRSQCPWKLSGKGYCPVCRREHTAKQRVKREEERRAARDAEIIGLLSEAA